MVSEPTVYSTTRENRVSEALEGARVDVEHLTRDLSTRLESRFSLAIHMAYAEGLRDGFAQGVTAECEKRAGKEKHE